MNLENQLIRIEEKLTLVREKDKEFKEFGSSKHKYVFNEKASEKAVANFELQYKIQLPEEFKSIWKSDQ